MSCSNCAKCCRAWGANGVSATDTDIKKWVDNSAHNILQYVLVKNNSYSKDLWVSPETGEKLSACPFLIINDGKSSCEIYPKEGETDLRPEICGIYPGGKLCIKELMGSPTNSNNGYELNMACFIRKR